MQTPTLITLTLSLLALSVSATPPACLLAAVNEQATPSDLKALCGTLENAVVGNITEKCVKDTYEEAVSSYKSTCLEGAGVTITITSSSASASASAAATGTSKASGSATATASGSGARITGSGSATGTSGSTASATGSAAAATVTATGNGAGPLVVPGFLGVVGLVGAFLF
ncbi:a5223f43-0c64-4c4d-90ba-ccd459d2b334 [Sclerotinia trifoliorum]|uniref:A5223f43-0c64-4c4d-90ba-ccd459d2b334 n=1 Tax=Sclerotinia trifoliorum TaxID=28548 RepID=A0A8H2VWA9_9HELO|nr:a5223f43-0c64-4c4d-90ba-ccd459d2b334 [Sclerotinia trifoliorum]